MMFEIHSIFFCCKEEVLCSVMLFFECLFCLNYISSLSLDSFVRLVFSNLSLSLSWCLSVFFSFLSACLTHRDRDIIYDDDFEIMFLVCSKKELNIFFKASILFPLKFSLSIYVCVFIGYMHCSKEEKEDSLHPSISLYWSFSLWLFFFEKKDAFFSFFRWMSLSVLYNNFFIFMAHVCVVVVVVI